MNQLCERCGICSSLTPRLGEKSLDANVIVLMPQTTKVLVETIEEPLKKRREKEAASAAQKRIIKKALRQLLGALDKIFEKHEEVGDTDVREKMSDAIHKPDQLPNAAGTSRPLPCAFGPGAFHKCDGCRCARFRSRYRVCRRFPCR